MSNQIYLLVANRFNTLKYLKNLQELDKNVFKSNPWCEQEFLLDLTDKDEFSFLTIDSDNNLLGYLYSYLYNENYIHISRIATDSRIQLTGIGSKMMQELIYISKLKKKKKITLEFDNKLEVSKFYNKFGFNVLTEDGIKKYLKTKDKQAKSNLYIGPYPSRTIMELIL